MAKTTAPALSFGASGSIAKTMVYGSWKGRSYVRRHVTPANPQSTEQVITRNAFSFLQAVYKFAPALVTEPWDAYAKGQPLTARNAFTKFNLSNLRDAGTIDYIVLCGGANGGPPPDSAFATPGDDQLSIAITPPSTLPQGWTVNGAIAAAIREQDPDSGQLFVVTAGEDLTSPYTVVLTGLDDSVEYQFRAWLRWNRPDGTFAYSPDIGGQATTT